MSVADQPLRFVLGEFDNAIEVHHPGDAYPSLVITSGGDYLTGDGTKPPQRAKGGTRTAAKEKPGEVTARELAPDSVTETNLQDGAVTEDALSPSLLARLLPVGRNPFDRADHEGTQDLDTVTDGVDRFALTGDERGHLALIEPEATKNSPDDFLLDRGNHTGQIPASAVDGLADGAFAPVCDSPELLSPGVATTGAIREFVRRALLTVDTALARKSVTREHLAFESVTGDAIAPRSIRNEHIAEDAEISLSALVVNPLARGRHTGTQPASTITGLGPLATLSEEEAAAFIRKVLADD